MKRLVALALTLIMLISLLGTVSALADEGDKLHITFWHNRASGAQYETVTAQINAFNETVGAEKGIYVDEVYIGGYPDLMTKAQMAGDDMPVVSVTGNTRVSIYVEDDLLIDMMPYIQRDGFDISNVFSGMYNCPYNNEETCFSLPYIKSTPVIYYNKTMAAEAGIEVPDMMTVSQLEEICKAMSKVDESGEHLVWGFESLNDFTYYQGAFLWQLGEPLWNEDGEFPALTGSSMNTVLTDWKRWVDEGWCRPFDSSNASATMEELFFNGKLFAYWNSCASMTNVSNTSASMGFELGVTNFPRYDEGEFVVPIGGGNISIMAGKTEEESEAGWEFIKFLFTDEMVAMNHMMSGYLPTTKSVAGNDEIAAFWAEHPLYKVAFDQLDFGIEQAYPYYEYNSQLKTNVQNVVSRMIQEGTLTGEEATQAIIKENADLF